MHRQVHRILGSQALITNNECPSEDKEMVWKNATDCSNKNACLFKDKLKSMYLKRPNMDRS